MLSQEEVARLINAAEFPFHRILLMTLYATGARRAEVARLKVSDIDSQRMVIHIRGGKGRKDRDVMLSPKLLDALRVYWRSLRRKPADWLFPGNRWHTGSQPVTTKVLWTACQRAAQRAGLEHRCIHPHTLRQAWAYYTTFQSPFILKTIGLDRRGFVEVYRAPRRAALTACCTSGSKRSFFSMIHGAYSTTCLAGRVRCRISRFTTVLLTAALAPRLLVSPSILVLEGSDLVISPQSGYTRCIPSFVLTGLVSETIQDSRDHLVLAYLR